MTTTETTDESVSGGENLEVMRDAHNYNRYLRELVRDCAAGETPVLDFGAGIGTFSDSTGASADEIYCVEPSIPSQTELRNKGFRTHSSLNEIADDSVSFAFSLNVLEHIDDHRGAVEELFRVVRPGGRLLIYVPAFSILFTSMDRHVGHVRRYRLGQLKRVIRDSGFSIERGAYADFLGFFATLAYRLVDKDEPKPLEGGLVRVYDRFIFPVSRMLSVVFARVMGKNVYVVARKPLADDRPFAASKTKG